MILHIFVSYIVCVHTVHTLPPDVPNAGRKLVTLDKRMDWDPKFRKHLKDLDAKKPVIMCGDLNVAHKEIG